MAKQIESASQPKRQSVPLHDYHDDSIPQPHDNQRLRKEHSYDKDDGKQDKPNASQTTLVLKVKPIKHLEYLSFFRCVYIISYYNPKVND